MSQVLKTQQFARTSLRGSRSPRTVLLQMAADEARADRIRQLKRDHPELTWRAIADHVGVSERAAVDWQKTGGIEYDNAGKLAELFPEVDVDYIWRGPAPDLMGTMNGSVPEDLQQQLNTLKAELTAELGHVSEQLDQVLTLIQLAATERAEETAQRAAPKAPRKTRRAAS